MSDDAREPVLEFRNVSKIYRSGDCEVRGLNEVSVRFASGELTALVGPSGSGKSTMQHLGAGFDRASEGSVLLMGRDIGAYGEKELSFLRNRHIGFIFQSFNLIPVMSAKVGIADQAKKRPHQLSGGQRQRVAIARALMNAPELIFADEPTANLDHEVGAGILDLLVGLNEELGTTIILSTHDSAVMARARRVVSLKDGRLVGDKR
jgi:putative ABC transport system ATP-binding protein